MNMMTSDIKAERSYDLPNAPLAMPKQVLEHDLSLGARLLQAIMTLLPAARAGH
ncbi:hypothetical protein [Halodurantibacterium flavum]|uniref:Uncharacterized protein n=1 Tax=Halodurantibacterium flavum TaxID=1382802 RepID=A0ABW4S6U5_9RHOB